MFFNRFSLNIILIRIYHAYPLLNNICINNKLKFVIVDKSLSKPIYYRRQGIIFPPFSKLGAFARFSSTQP